MRDPSRISRLTWRQGVNKGLQLLMEQAAQDRRIAQCIETDPAAVETLQAAGGGWRWVRLHSPDALRYEGVHMNHCLASGMMDCYLEQEGTRFVSLRDPSNKPACTMAWRPYGSMTVQGPCNGPLQPHVRPIVISYLRAILGLKEIHGGGTANLRIAEGRLHDLADPSDAEAYEAAERAARRKREADWHGFSLLWLKLCFNRGS